MPRLTDSQTLSSTRDREREREKKRNMKAIRTSPIDRKPISRSDSCADYCRHNHRVIYRELDRRKPQLPIPRHNIAFPTNPSNLTFPWTLPFLLPNSAGDNEALRTPQKATATEKDKLIHHHEQGSVVVDRCTCASVATCAEFFRSRRPR